MNVLDLQNINKNMNKINHYLMNLHYHYKENKSSRNWPIECGVYMNTKSKKEWEQALKKVGFKSVTSWQVGQKKDWAGTLVIMGKKNEL